MSKAFYESLLERVKCGLYVYTLTILTYMGISTLMLIIQGPTMEHDVLFKCAFIASLAGNLIFFFLGFFTKFNNEELKRLLNALDENNVPINIVSLTIAYISLLPLTILYINMSSVCVGGLEPIDSLVISLIANCVHCFYLCKICDNMRYKVEYGVLYYTTKTTLPFTVYIESFMFYIVILVTSNYIIGDICIYDTLSMAVYLSFLMTLSSFLYVLWLKTSTQTLG